MSDNSTTSSGGVGFCGLLAVLFIGLKLLNIIHWSWWWVLAPLWLPFVIVLAVLAAIGIGLLAAAFIGDAAKSRARKRRP